MREKLIFTLISAEHVTHPLRFPNTGDFYNFPQEWTMMLEVFPDDNLRSTAGDRKKIESLLCHALLCIALIQHYRLQPSAACSHAASRSLLHYCRFLLGHYFPCFPLPYSSSTVAAASRYPIAGNSPQRAATRGCGRLWPARRGDCQRRARNGRSPAASLQEVAHGAPTRGWLPTANPQGATASRVGGTDRRGGRPLAGRLSATTHSAAGCTGAVAAAVQEGEGEG
ncbi:hypothetical protein GW17_00034523 [Ensete ventricosum]|nr:hypothetical protein GW17_00034523 [Ensete ventricosum]